jgi:hypothetical protein
LVVVGDEEGTRKIVSELEGWELLELDWNTEGARIHT